jgi:hypothetical protein
VCPALWQERPRGGEVARVALDGVHGHPDQDVAGEVGAVGEGEAFGRGFALDAGGDLRGGC